MKKKLLVSVSGGRTSGLMAKLLWDRFKEEYEMVFVFANTSREEEATLQFVKNLEVNFLLPIVWVEAKVHHGIRKASTHIITDFKNAKRDGSLFEEVIKKYGIPHSGVMQCTRELKHNSIRSYAKSVGFDKAIIAVGYRADEPKRVNLVKANQNNQWYPLYEWGIKKPDVANFWIKQSFDLKLEDWEGNCILCHKKSKRKLLTKILKDPKSTFFHEKMEDKYSMSPPPKYNGALPMRFFRDRESIKDLIEDSKEPFNLSVDQSLVTLGSEYDFELDTQEDCAESCEPF